MTPDSGSSWVIGVGLCFLSSFGTGLSKLAIRKSWLLQLQDARSNVQYSLISPSSSPSTNERTNDEKSLSENTDKTSFRLRTAALFFMTFLNPAFDIAAMSFASPSILAPFSGVSLAWVVLLSKRLVGEQPEPVRVLGASLIMLGEFIVAIFGDHSSHDDVTLAEMRDSYLEPAFVALMISTVVFECILAYWMFLAQNKFLKRFAWGVAGGFMTGYQNFIKDAITIIKASGEILPWKLPWYFFLLVALAGLTAFGGLVILAACMKRYDATYSSGTFAGGMVLSASIMSAVHYNTFSHLEPGGLSHAMYPLGLIILMLGVGLLMHHSKDASVITRRDELPVLHGSSYTDSSVELSNAKVVLLSSSANKKKLRSRSLPK